MGEPVAIVRDRWTRPRRLATAWVLAAACLFLWWAAHYSSLIEDLGEWQFDRFGLYRPTLTLALLVGLITIPVAIILWRRARRAAHAQRERLVDAGLDPAAAMVTRARAGTVRARLFAGAIAIAAAVLAVAVAISTVYLPTGDGIPTAIKAGATLTEGPAHLEGRYRVGRVARLTENVVFAWRSTYVAPVQLIGDRAGATQLVTTVLLRPEGGFAPITSGVLVHKGTPRELRNLYAQVGTPVAEDGYMLMRDEDQVSWRSWVLAVQIAIVALMAAIAWLLSRRRDRRLLAMTADPVTS
ncbi:hypothetical protein [Sphingomonas sp.]|uniref:hypothetical protein n=1 Tax=Sphingomonas sp. TaxID=28214 RepID=UPI003B00E123